MQDSTGALLCHARGSQLFTSTHKSSSLLRFPSCTCTCTGHLSSGACWPLPCPKLEVNMEGCKQLKKVVIEPRMKENQNCSKMRITGNVQSGRGLTAIASGLFQRFKMCKSQIMELQIRVKFLRKQLWPMQTRSETSGISCFSVTLCWVLSL